MQYRAIPCIMFSCCLLINLMQFYGCRRLCAVLSLSSLIGALKASNWWSMGGMVHPYSASSCTIWKHLVTIEKLRCEKFQGIDAISIYKYLLLPSTKRPICTLYKIKWLSHILHESCAYSWFFTWSLLSMGLSGRWQLAILAILNDNRTSTSW